MITLVNPGRILEVVGTFDLHTLPGRPPVVYDPESDRRVELGSLLRSFLEDPDDTSTGLIRIRIEPGLARTRGPF